VLIADIIGTVDW